MGRRRALILLFPLHFAAATGQEAWGPGESEVVFSEIGYHPPEEEGKRELVELHNAGVSWVDVGGWTFTAGIELTIPEGTVIGPGGYLVVARDAAALKAAWGISNVVGDFKGSLGNTGDILELRNRTGRVVAWIHYGDGSGPEGDLWPDAPDGLGPTLELIDPRGDWHRAWSWGASRVPGGTPGAENSRNVRRRPAAAALPPLRINEARLDEPRLFVELVAEADAAQKLDGLRLTTDPRGAGGAAVAGSATRRKPWVLEGQAIKPLLGGGSVLFLVVGATREIVDAIPVRKGLPPEASFGRFPDGSGGVSSLPKATPGAPNAAPPPSDLVLSEILYHGRSDSKDEELVEVHNRGKAAVPLKGWRLDRGISFRFPDDAVLPPGGCAVVAGSPEKVRARAGPAAKLVFGPFEGSLADSGETIALIDGRGDVADRVEYQDSAPWPAAADGGGASLELIDPALDNRWPQAWTLGPPGGSPGRLSPRAEKGMDPAIAGVRHEPAVPSPEEAVTVHAHVLDTGKLAEVAVVYRDANAGSRAVKKAMADTGQADDGAARDGHYAAKLPRFKAGSLVGFAVQARDASGNVVRWPEGDRECYFQVEARAREDSGPGMPVYRILMPRQTWERFRASSPFQDNLFACTFVATFEGSGVNPRGGVAFYNAQIRYRGNNSRSPEDGRMSYRVRLSSGDFFDGRDRLILNAYATLRQKAGGDAMRSIGLPVSDAALVRLVTPGLDDPRYLDVEVVDSEFLDRRFGSSRGDIFRGERGRGPSGGADLVYRGPDPAAYEQAYLRVNRKRSGATLGPLIKMLEALATKDEDQYAKRVEEAIDPAEWAAYFAANHVLGNNENGLSTGAPDDYFLAQRPGDGKFVLVPWDQDSVFQRSPLEPLFPAGLPAVRRFLQHQRFAPLYHRAARELLDGPLSRPSLRARLSRLAALYPEETVASIESFVERRQVQLRTRYVLWPQATAQGDGSQPAASGAGTRVYLGSDGGGGVTLSGLVDPAVAFKVRAGGALASYEPVSGRWTARGASGGDPKSPFWVELLGSKDDVVALHAISLVRAPAVSPVDPSITGKAEWRAGGPYVLRGNAVVAPGASLRIGPGVNVVCMPGSSIEVRGTLVVEGSALEPVTFRPADMAQSWSGIAFRRTGAGAEARRHGLGHCRFEGGRARLVAEGSEPIAGVLAGSFLQVDGSSVALERCVFRGVAGAAVGSEGGSVELRSTRVADCRSGIVQRGGTLLLDGVEVSRVQGEGLRLWGLPREGALVRSSVFRDILGAAVAVEGGAATLASVLVHRSGTALAVAGGARVKASHVTVAEGATGVAVDPLRRARPATVVRGARAPAPPPPPVPAGRSAVEITESVFGLLVEPIAARAGSQVKLSSCVLPLPQGAQAPAGDGLRHELPRFAAPQRGDFRLEKGSPGSAAGPGGKDWGFTPAAAADGAGR
ncbi:MAG: lamin tail domain-containing protein [Planctomycetes bacterium]|nr:lamin tail domain-containing protein [Planctomycetota bacterium]